MKVVVILALLWFAGSYLTYRTVGTGGILPYIGITSVLIALGCFIAYKRGR